MKEKKDCKIVQDLLPNYIENLTNEETNYFIEEHLKECSECQKVLENMKKELKVNSSKRDGREVNYIKKYNSKLKILRNILFTIIIIALIVIGRKTFILTSLENKAQELRNGQNYYLKLESYSEGKMTITEAYYKEEKSLVEIVILSKDLGEVKQTLYKSGEEIFSLIDNGETKLLQKTGDISVRPIDFTSNSFLENLYIAITTSVDKVELNGKECYMIRDGNTEKFIDANTGLAIKMIDNQNNRTVDYKYEYGVVKDKDVERPDTTGYTISAQCLE